MVYISRELYIHQLTLKLLCQIFRYYAVVKITVKNKKYLANYAKFLICITFNLNI